MPAHLSQLDHGVRTAQVIAPGYRCPSNARSSGCPGDPRPQLVLGRHGSLPAAVVRRVLADVGFGLVLAPRATTRLQPRRYAEGPGEH